MIQTVLLCSKQWEIEKILYEQQAMLSEGQYLTECVSDSAVLMQLGEQAAAVSLFFPQVKQDFSAVAHVFPQKYLVLLANIEKNDDFIQFMNIYRRCISWTEDHADGLYHNEYYQIQQINNQLADSQRALARSNRKLKQAFHELEQANGELEQARQTAVQAMDMANRASQFKSAFLANMSHDIRTPMNTIIGIADLMQHSLNDPEKLSRYADKLHAAGQHLLDLINDILDVNKIESGSVELREEHIDLTQQLEQIETIIRPQAQERGQEFDIRVTDVQCQNFIGDATRLRQILLNILSNAVKYTQNGGKIVFDIMERPYVQDSYVKYTFVITDNGMGMTPEFQKVLFHSFTRAQNANEIQGTGLGMVITKGIVELMGGTIAVDSAPKKGSRFEVTLTFLKDTEAPVKNTLRVQKNEMHSVLAGMKLLCAEDNELNAEILHELLAHAGASCTIYSDGQQLYNAFEQLKPGEYDVILMDVQMPYMNGYEATRAIRNGDNPLGRSIPIIAMTANAFSDDVQKSLDCGMDAHISKPIDMTLMEQTMQRFCILNSDGQKRQFVRNQQS